jgi:hypothetical protein
MVVLLELCAFDGFVSARVLRFSLTHRQSVASLTERVRGIRAAFADNFLNDYSGVKNITRLQTAIIAAVSGCGALLFVNQRRQRSRIRNRAHDHRFVASANLDVMLWQRIGGKAGGCANFV